MERLKNFVIRHWRGLLEITLFSLLPLAIMDLPLLSACMLGLGIGSVVGLVDYFAVDRRQKK